MIKIKKIKIGKITSTHNIKGELKILSNFEYKDKIFKIGNKIIINNKEYEIKSYRKHKNFDMVTLDDYKNINDVLFLVKQDVYIDSDKLKLEEDEILDEDLIKFNVLTSKGKKGIIKEIFWASPSNKILRVLLDKEVLIPVNSPMIKKIDKEKKEILVELIDGM